MSTCRAPANPRRSTANQPSCHAAPPHPATSTFPVPRCFAKFNTVSAFGNPSSLAGAMGLAGVETADVMTRRPCGRSTRTLLMLLLIGSPHAVTAATPRLPAGTKTQKPGPPVHQRAPTLSFNGGPCAPACSIRGKHSTNLPCDPLQVSPPSLQHTDPCSHPYKLDVTRKTEKYLLSYYRPLRPRKGLTAKQRLESQRGS